MNPFQSIYELIGEDKIQQLCHYFYEEVAKRLNTSPQKILFFDDLKENLMGAEQVGYQTHLINHPKALINFFENVL